MNKWESLISGVKPDIRTIQQMRAVLADPECEFEKPVYEMYRDVADSDDDHEWLAAHNLRYDITRIPSLVLCREFVKTKGHYHPVSQDGTPYPEVYEILKGEAHYLIQTRNLSDIIMIHAKKGDVVIIPPFYGHVTINPSSETLTMANIVSSAFSSDYLPYEELKGAAYYEFSDGSIHKNPKYSSVPELRHIQADMIKIQSPLPVTDIYSYIGDEKALDFLNKPGSYLDLFREMI